MDNYEDVKLSGINPLIYFLKFGLPEGRLEVPDQNENGLTSDAIFRRIHPIRSVFIPYGSPKRKIPAPHKKVDLRLASTLQRSQDDPNTIFSET